MANSENRDAATKFFRAMCKNPRHAMLAECGRGRRERANTVSFRRAALLGRVLRTPDRSLHSDDGIKTAAGIPEREGRGREQKDGVGDSALFKKQAWEYSC